MKISEKIVNVFNQLSTQTPKYESRNPCLTIKVDPKDKALIAFVFKMASWQIEGHYNEIDTGIRSNSFTYELQGDADEVTFNFNYKCFRAGSTLPDYFNKLRPAIIKLLDNISKGWVPGAKSFYENEYNYENHNIAGTYYVYLLQEITTQLGINVKGSNTPGTNALYFSAWLPVDHWSLANHIALGGNSKLILKFFDAISTELKIVGDFVTEKNVSLDKEIIVHSTEGRAVVDLSNARFAGSITVKVSNMPRGTTFIQELTEKNQKDARADKNAVNESIKSVI